MISPISTAPTSSEAIGIIAGVSTTTGVPAARLRREEDRRALGRRVAVLEPDADAAGLRRDVAVLRAGVAVLRADVAVLRARVAVLRAAVAGLRRVVAVLLVALRRAVLAALRVRVVARFAVVLARRRVELAVEPVPRAIRRACFVSPSMRLNTLLMSARVLAFFACDCRVFIAARAVFSASLMRRSACRRTSGGTRFSASLSARLPALTARPTMPDRLLVRLRVAMRHLRSRAVRSV